MKDKNIGNIYLNMKEKKENYFEGWYFKFQNKKDVLAIIVGIATNKEDEHSFIQINIDEESHYIRYKLSDFKYKDNVVEIKGNYFSKNEVILNIEELNLTGKVAITDMNIIDKNIMGPFANIKMECNHDIITMKSNINGKFVMKDKDYVYKDDYCYIEKDYGTNFPKHYLWLNAMDKETSIFLATAHIPILNKFSFEGFINVVNHNNKNYYFSTYNFSKLIKNGNIIVLKHKKDELHINIKQKEGKVLVAPINGKMEKPIIESLNSKVLVKLISNKKVVFSKQMKQVSLEIVD